MPFLSLIFALGVTSLTPEPRLETGDLVFLDLDCGELCTSIAAVTRQQLNPAAPNLSHVGVVDRESGSPMILEAWPVGGVKLTPWQEFSARVKDPKKLIVQRIAPEWRAQAEAAVKEMKKYLGSPYDPIFSTDLNRFYCSELILVGWKEIPGSPFNWRPMYFGSPTSPDFRIWSDYYSTFGMEPLSGWAGVSPLGIFLDASLISIP